MSTVPQVKRNVRKALEAPLRAVSISAGLPVEWPGIDFPRKDVPKFFRFDIHYGPPVIETIGQQPRISMEGYAAIGVFTPIGAGQDMNDDMAALIGPAYPYDANLAFGGVSVNISALETRDSAEAMSWRFSPVIVPWNVWRVA